MKKTSVFLCAAFMFLLPQLAHASGAEGYWLTENKRAVIHLKSCDNSLCGNIYWIIEGGMQYDSKNPDPRAKDKPMCGLQLLKGFKKKGDNWKNGKIYKADEGKIYDANITVKNPTTLTLRGYIGMPLFGKSQTWTRVSADDYKQCTTPK